MSNNNMPGSYTFDDYDAFLASLTNNQQSLNQQQNSLPNVQVKREQNNSYSSGSVLSEEENPYFNSNGVDPTQSQGTWNQPQFLSPDFTSNSNSNESSPHELFNNDIFDFTNPLGLGNPNNIAANNNKSMNRDFLKLEKTTSLPVGGYGGYSQTQLPEKVQQTAKKPHVKLSEAVPNTSHVCKNGKVKKEKSTHNMIEKRYRTNINDKINALRDSVPALRVLIHDGCDDEYEDENKELDGLQPAKKLNKATILAKATEYIKHLEMKNDILKKENDDLRQRIYGETPRSSIDSSNSQYIMSNNGNNFTNKVLLGGLTCMVGSSLSDDLNNMDTRQLFALPIISFNNQGGIQYNYQFINLLLRFSLLFGVLLYFLAPLFNKKPETENKQRVFDVDNLKYLNGPIFTAPKSRDNNNLVKFLIFKCFQLRLNYGSNEIIHFITTLMWNCCKEIKIVDNEKLTKILSKPNELTLDNKKFVNKLKLDYGKDESLIRKLFNFTCEMERNSILKKFLVNSIENKEQFKFEEISTDSLELKTLFNPTEENVKRYTEVLDFHGLLIEGEDNETEFSNDLIVLNAAKILKSVNSNDSKSISLELKNLNVNTIILNNEKLNLLGFTSLYLISLRLNELIKPNQLEEESLIKLEELSSFLRIWVSENAQNYQILNAKKPDAYKFKLIQFFININLSINYGLIEENK